MNKNYILKIPQTEIDPELLKKNILWNIEKREINMSVIRDREREKLNQKDGLLNGNKNHNA